MRKKTKTRKLFQINYIKFGIYSRLYKMKQKMIVMHVVSIDMEATEADNKEAWGITSKKPSYLKHTRIKAEEKQKLDLSLVARFPVATVENLAL